MVWKVAIEGKPNQRILVRFDPLTETIFFHGQFKPHNKEWFDFSIESYPMDIDLDTLQEMMGKAYRKMRDRLVAYNNVADGFTIIKEVRIQREGEELVPITTVGDNSVYGSPVIATNDGNIAVASK
jgi:hypothetical protein